MEDEDNYVIGSEGILLKAYRLLCVILADKEIRRRAPPKPFEYDAIVELEKLHFRREVSTLLLEIAVAVRVVDEQLRKLPQDGRTFLEHAWRSQMAVRFIILQPHNAEQTMRFICNKIIHAERMQFVWAKGVEVHAWDFEALRSGGPPTQEWEHRDSYVEIEGSERVNGKKKPWHYRLDIEAFARAIYYLLRHPIPDEWIKTGLPK